MTKECKGCELSLPVGHFHPRNDTEDGFSSRCKTCIKNMRHNKPLEYKNTSGLRRRR